MSTRRDVNSDATIFSAIVLGTVGVLSFIVQPGLVQGFVVELGLSEAAANDLAFAEMLGVAAATYIAALVCRFVDWRAIVAVALMLAALGNLASAALAQPDLFRLARFVTGLGEGGIISLSFAVIGLTAKTERNLALYLVLLLTYGAVGLWIMPRAFAAVGLGGIFLFWSGVTLVSLATVRFLPAGAHSRTAGRPTAVTLHARWWGLALFGVLLYNTAIGIAWANLFLIGMEIRPDAQAVANALLLAQFVAIAGALVSVFMEARLGRWLPIIVGVFGGAAFIAALLANPSYRMFALAVSGFNFLWNMVLPFILSAVSDMDETGTMMSRAIAMQMTGLGFGPFFAARILDAGGGFAAVEWATIVLLAAGFFALVLPMLAHRRALQLAAKQGGSNAA
ncbi:MAG: MFS transporter [Alphaproteobacteria bacterium]|nr:MAG: MFS transporter [Alphaproteobacteria bacterium]